MKKTNFFNKLAYVSFIVHNFKLKSFHNERSHVSALNNFVLRINNSENRWVYHVKLGE